MAHPDSRPREYIANCPGCQTFETVWVVNGKIQGASTSVGIRFGKFIQTASGGIYHDCHALSAEDVGKWLCNEECYVVPTYREGEKLL